MINRYQHYLVTATSLIALGIFTLGCGLQGQEKVEEPTKVDQNSTQTAAQPAATGKRSSSETLADQTPKFPVAIEMHGDSDDGFGLSSTDIKYLGTVVCLSGHVQNAVRDASTVTLPETARDCKFFFTHQLIVDGVERDISSLTTADHENGAATSFDGITLQVISNYIAVPSSENNSFVFAFTQDD